MNGLRLLTLEEKNALAVLADAVDRCREEDMRTLDGSSCEALNPGRAQKNKSRACDPDTYSARASRNSSSRSSSSA
jgi:hypothetical protein